MLPLPRGWRSTATGECASQLPVEPKPPCPRSESGSSGTSSSSASTIGTTTSWATRSPRPSRTVSSPWLMRITLSSPR